MRLRQFLRILSCLAVLTAAPLAARAQPAGADAPPQAGGRQGATRARPAPSRPRPFLDGLPGARLFRPRPEDFRPLDEQERESIQQFIRKYAPDLHRQLRKLQRENPERFKQRLDESAPRLRALRRIFERDPALGRAILRYAENYQRLMRARRLWRQDTITPDVRRRLRAAVRRLAADNLRIERDVLNDHLTQLQAHRQDRLERELQRLADPTTDLSGESPEIRDLAEQLRQAVTEKERATLRAQLAPLVERSIDEEIERTYRRVKRMREHAPEEVDRRVKRFFARSEQTKPKNHAPRDGRPRAGRRDRRHTPPGQSGKKPPNRRPRKHRRP